MTLSSINSISNPSFSQKITNKKNESNKAEKYVFATLEFVQ